MKFGGSKRLSARAKHNVKERQQFMPLYEHIFLGRQDISAQQFEGLIETYQTIITENGGSVAKTEYWGPKVLAYKIKKNRKAHFALMDIDAPHEAVAEMERQMGISTDVIRFLTLRVDEHETGPSAMMKRGDRDDRRGGRRDRDGGRRERGGAPRPRDRGAEKPAAQAAAEKPAAQAKESNAESSPDKSDAGKAAKGGDAKAEE